MGRSRKEVMEKINKGLPKNDQDWLRLLAGEEVQDADSDIQACASALRQNILDRHAKAENKVSAEEIRQGKQRLLFRLRKEGLLDSSQFKTSKWNYHRYGMAIAASIVLLVVAPTVFQHFLSSQRPGQVVSPPPVVKKFIMPQTIYTKNPKTEAEKLQRELSGIGLQVEKTEETGSVLLAIMIKERSVALETILKKWNLELVKGDTLLVEFLKKP
jgi:hypothetical protein